MYQKSLSLSIIVSLILVLSNSMERAGQMKNLLDCFRGLIRNTKLNIIVFPSLIGLLPMPGGAIFSAPMVKELGAHSGYSPARLSFVNYWFRHVWEYWWPLYPGVLLITVLADINIVTLMFCLFPLTLLVLGIGFTVLRGNVPGLEKASPSEGRPSIRPFLKELLPILIVIIPGLGAGILFSTLFPGATVAKEAGLILALLLAIAWVWGANRMQQKVIRKILLDPQMLSMIYMILSILIFKGMLEDSRAVIEITRELTLIRIPLIIIVGVLPFIVGMISGITIAFVGSTFPILIPLVASFDPAGNLLFYMMLAMTCGFAGVLMSPLHLCLILSNEYFGATMEQVYRHLWFRCIYLIIGGVAYFYLLKSISEVMA